MKIFNFAMWGSSRAQICEYEIAERALLKLRRHINFVKESTMRHQRVSLNLKIPCRQLLHSKIFDAALSSGAGIVFFISDTWKILPYSFTV